MASEKLIQAVQLIKSGDKQAALLLLKEVVQADPNDENAWLWLHTCVEQVEQKKYCLQRALKINPNNQQARNALLKLENRVSVDSILAHPPVSISPVASTKIQSSEHIHSPDKARETKTRKNILPLVVIIGLSACALFSLLVIVIVKPPVLSQIFSVFTGGSYSSSMKPVINELQEWLNGPVNQYEQDLTKPYGHGEPSDYTNLDAINFYEIILPELGTLGYSQSEIVQRQQEMRSNLSENLFPTLNNIKQDGFVIVTKLEGINPPDSIRSAHERVTSCVNYKIEIANAMIVFLETGDASNTPNGDCNFFEESLQTISDFIK